MKIKIKNLGALKQAEFSPGDLTIICGKNNTGKTYATYAFFGFLSFWWDSFSIKIENEVVNRLLADGTVRLDVTRYVKQAEKIIADGCREYTGMLPDVLAAGPGRFKDTEFQVKVDPGEISLIEKYETRLGSPDVELFVITKSKGSTELIVTLLVEKEKIRIPNLIIENFIGEVLKRIVFRNLFPDSFIASTERTGAAIFLIELDFARNRLLDRMIQTGKKKKFDPMNLLKESYQRYALPVTKNVDFTRQLATIAKQSSYITKEHPDVLSDFADIIEGEYIVIHGVVYYVPKGKSVKLSMGESSSAVRSLLDIGFYLKHIAQPGEMLMVDEPELNLHPENQRRMARLFARLVNLGIKVFITTHSDYIIKELNTLIMLNHDKPHLKRIAEKQGYKKEELISADQVKVYIAEEAPVKLNGNTRKSRGLTFTPADIDPELGIEARSFDITIDEMNRIQDEIVWGEG